MTGAGFAIYSIVTICNSAALSECRPLIGFTDYQPGYTRSICEKATTDVVEEWLKANSPKWFISSVRCSLNEERGA